MKPLSLLEALGLAQQDVEPLEHKPLPEKSTGQGLVAANTPATRLFEPFVVLPVALPSIEPSLRIVASFQDPRVLLVESARAPLRHSRAVTSFGPGSKLWLLDGRSQRESSVDAREPGAAAIFGDVVVVVDEHAVSVSRVRSAVQKLMTWEPRPPVSISALGADALTGGRPTAAWLRDAATVLASSSGAFERSAAVGLIGRLWISDSLANETFDDALVGRGPAFTARAWFDALSEDIKREIDRQACDESDSWLDALEHLPLEGDALCDRDVVRRVVYALLQRRDDLESIAFLLDGQLPEAELPHQLSRLDREASTQFSYLLGFSFDDDARLSTVAWQEPNSWWARLAGR
jgi:hypothetical protein